MAAEHGSHENFARREPIETSSDRAFGIVFTVVFGLLAATQLWKGSTWGYLAGAASATFLLLSYTAPRLLAPLNRVWTRFGLLLHKVVSPVVLGFLFFFTVTPIGLMLRLFGKDPLRLKLDPGARSYWIERQPPGPLPATMRDQF